MEVDLKRLRVSKNISAKEMVEVIKALYPKYDKTIQSKCENGKSYGVSLRKDAEEAIINRFAPEIKKYKKDDHRLTCRISCRLEDEVYHELMKNVKTDGYITIQSWLTDVVRKYNGEKKERSCK